MHGLITKLDIFSVEAKLLNKGNNLQAKNLFGGLISILAISSILGFIIYFLQEFFGKNEPNIVSSTLISKEKNISIADVPVLYKLTNHISMPIENVEKYLTMVAFYVGNKYNATSNGFDRVFESQLLTKCDPDKHYPKYKDLFSGINPDDYFCFEKNPEYNLFGLYGDSESHGYTMVNVLPCANATSVYGYTVENCMDQESIDTFIEYSPIYLNLLYMDNQITPYNEKPYEQVLNQARYSVRKDTLKYLYQKLRHFTYTTDVGLVFEELSEDKFYVSEEIKTDNNPTNRYGYLITHYLSNSNKIENHKRVYMKAQTLIANLGGIIKSIMLIATIINSIISKQYYYLNIINSNLNSMNCNNNTNIIDIDFNHQKENKNKNKNSALNLSQNNSKINILENNNYNNNKERGKESIMSNNYLNHGSKNIKCNSITSKITSKQKYKKISSNNQIRLSIIDYIIPSFINKSKNMKIYNLYKERVNKYLNVENLVNNFIQFETIKSFVLDKNQLNVFNTYYDNNSSSDNNNQKEIKFIESYDEILNNIKGNNNSNNSNSNNINYNLINNYYE